MKKTFLLLCATILGISVANAQTWGVKAGSNLSTLTVSAEGLSASAKLGQKPGFYIGGIGNINFGSTAKWGLQYELIYNYEGARLSLGDKVMSAIINDPTTVTALNIKDPFVVGLTTHNVKVPVMVKFQPKGGLSIMAGPYVSYRVATAVRGNKDLSRTLDMALSTAKAAGEEVPFENFDAITKVAKNLIDDNLKKFDVGATIGVEYAMNNGLFVDFRYNLGLMNLLPSKITGKSLENVKPGIKDLDVKEVCKGIMPSINYGSFQLGVGFRF